MYPANVQFRFFVRRSDLPADAFHSEHHLDKKKPQGYDDYAKNESRVLGLFEKIGEALVTCCALIFSDFNIRGTWWAAWLVLSFVLMVLYEVYWVRYFKSERKMSDFYRSLAGFPVAGASLPVAAFFLLGIYGTNIFMLISSVILGTRLPLAA